MADDEIAAETLAGWLHPDEAVQRLGMGRSVGIGALLDRLSADLIQAGARHRVIAVPNEEDHRADFVLIPAKRWKDGNPVRQVDRFWHSSDVTWRVEHRNFPSTTYAEWSYFGVRFDPAGVDGLLPPPPPPAHGVGAAAAAIQAVARAMGSSPPDPKVAMYLAPPNATPLPKHPGGKPPLTFWEDAILAIGHRIHMGAFKPQRQADVQRALAEWIVQQGYEEPGATALKERAAKVFKTFGE